MFRRKLITLRLETNEKMKNRIIAITAIAVAAWTAVAAQTTTRWGVTAGVNYNQIHFKQSDIVDVKRGFGPAAGVTGEMNIHGIGFALEASLLYSMHSSKINFGQWKVWSSDGLGNETVMLHNIDVPVALKFKYNRLNGFENTLKPMVYFGPTFSFRAGGSHRDHIKYNSLTVMLRAGVGMELFNRFQLSVSYNFSVGETLHTVKLDSNAAKNRCWALTATYYFKE